MPSPGRTRRWTPNALAGRMMWPMFKLGYLTALDDVDRTGLRPNREDTKERAAERAWERLRP